MAGLDPNKVEVLAKDINKNVIGRTAFNVTQAEIAKKNIDSSVRGLVSDAMKTFKTSDERMKEQKLQDLQDAAAKKGLTVKEYKKLTAVRLKGAGVGLAKAALWTTTVAVGGTAMFFLGGIIPALGVGGYALLKKSIKRTKERQIAVKNYKRAAETAILETGKLDAGAEAIERWRKNQEASGENYGLFAKKKAKSEALKMAEELKNDFAGRAGSEDDAFARVKFAAKKGNEDALDAAADESLEKNSNSAAAMELKKIFGDYAAAIATDPKNAKDAKDVLQKALDGLAKNEKGKKDKVLVGDYDKLIKNIDKMFGGGYSGLAGYTKEEQVAAIKMAVNDKMKVNLANVHAGLKTKEVLSVSDKATLRTFAVIGAAIGVGGDFAKSIARSKIVQKLGGSTWLAIGASALVGGLVGAYKKRKELKRKNIEQATSGRKATDEREKTDFMMWNSEDLTNQMQMRTAAIKKAGKAEKTDVDAAVDLMATFEAARRLENDNKNKFALISYNNRQGIEKARLELFKRRLALKKQLEKFGITDIDDRISNRVDSLISKTGEMGKVTAETKGWRRHAVATAALKGAVVAATAAGIGKGIGYQIGTQDSFANRHWGVGEKLGKVLAKVAKAEDLRMNLWKEVIGDKPWLNKFIGYTSFVSANAMAGRGGKAVDTENNPSESGEKQGNKPSTVDEKPETVKGPEDELTAEKVRATKAGLLVEEDPQGGTAVGFDLDGNGHLDKGEFLYGYGDEPGINLANEADYLKLNNTLNERFNMNLERGEYSYLRYGKISVSDYMNNNSNVVKGNINVLDKRSEELVTIHRPTTVTTIEGSNFYEVKIDGNIPEGAHAYVDLDGSGSMGAIDLGEVRGGKVLMPCSLADTDSFLTTGKADFYGRFAIGKFDGDSFIGYGADTGKMLTGDTIITGAMNAKGFAYTLINNQTGEAWSQFAVDESGQRVTSNLSEIFNGLDERRVPEMFRISDIDGEGELEMADGTKIPDYDYRGGYRPEYDSSLNDVYKMGENPNLVGTPYKIDLDGNGVISPEEKAIFVKQYFIATGTDINVLAQNASCFGMLERDTLQQVLFNGDAEFMQATLASWGITDGVVDNMTELNLLMNALKGDPDMYDKLVNATLNAMKDELQGCEISFEFITNRESTYLLKGEDLMHCGNGTRRPIAYFFRRNADGSRTWLGNKGFLARELGAGPNGRVGVMTTCRQLAVEEKNTTETTKTAGEGTKKTGEGTKTKEKTKTSEKTKTDPEKTKTDPEKTKTDPEKTKTDPEKTKTDPEKTKTDPEKTKTDPENTKTDPEGTKTDPENTKVDPEVTNKNAGEKTGDFHAGPNASEMGETELKPNTEYVEATPDNAVSADVKPGAPVHDADASIYQNDTVVDTATGEPMTDSAGNVYITKPEELVEQELGGQVTDATKAAINEEVAQNIVDDTQTTFTPDTTKWSADATETVMPDYTADAATNAATDTATNAAVDTATNTAADTTTGTVVNTAADTAEEVIGGGADTSYSAEDLDALLEQLNNAA